MVIYSPTWSDRGTVCGRCSPSLRSGTRAAPFMPYEAETLKRSIATASRAQNRYPEGRLSRAPERRPASVDCIYCCYDQNDQGLRRGRQRAINAGPIWPPSRGRSFGGCDLQRAAQAMTAVGSELINDDGSLAFLSAVRAHRPQSRIINAYSSCIREVSIGPPTIS